MADKIIISLLLDRYGVLLSEKQRYLMECYYNDDLSLSEIAENEGITRQGVRDTLKRCEAALFEYEEKLRLNAQIATLKEMAQNIKAEDDAAQALTEYIDNL